MASKPTDELLARAAAGDLTPAEAEQLAERCKTDPETLDQLAATVTIDRLLPDTISDDGAEFTGEFIRRASHAHDRDSQHFAASVVGTIRRWRFTRAAIWTTAAAAAFALLTVFWPGGVKEQTTVAEIVRVEAGDWPAESRNLSVGSRLSFDTGLIELRYELGATLVLEAPADFEITGKNSGFLHRGRLVAEVNEERAKGFTIDGPTGKLIDLGTKFGVAVHDSGEMEVHVLEGIVDAAASGGKTVRLHKNDALRLAAGKSHPLSDGADEGAFVTQIPPKSGRPARYVRWSFDEDSGPVAKDSGDELGGGKADAMFRSFSGNKGGPRRFDGPFGNAIALDGEDAFLESEFRGIGGTAPRTVAFWAKIPKDLGRLQSYGIINWGSTGVNGAAWQISANPVRKDGPIGALRIGTVGGEVVGTTDLRDGVWHHCAVVMYGDAGGKPNTATHVLLYIDGQLEPAARKSVRVIDTKIDIHKGSRDHGIWLGRNLVYHHKNAWAGNGKFFRGAVDEVVVSDTALDRNQIRRLMEKNLMPAAPNR